MHALRYAILERRQRKNLRRGLTVSYAIFERRLGGMQFVCHFGAKFKERVEMKYQFSLISNNDMFEFGIVSNTS